MLSKEKTTKQREQNAVDIVGWKRQALIQWFNNAECSQIFSIFLSQPKSWFYSFCLLVLSWSQLAATYPSSLKKKKKTKQCLSQTKEVNRESFCNQWHKVQEEISCLNSPFFRYLYKCLCICKLFYLLSHFFSLHSFVHKINMYWAPATQQTDTTQEIMCKNPKYSSSCIWDDN